MRLGAPVTGYTTSEEWAQLNVDKGYGATYWPLADDAPDDEIDAFVAAAERHDLVIAEVGVWNNLLDRDETRREANIARAIARLRTAERIGARCCVNISGSKADQWDGPHPDNLTDQTFSEIVGVTRRIIDAVKPVRTRYSLEPMAWAYPCDLESSIRLIEAVDRPALGVHVDMCNMVSSCQKAYKTGEMTRAYFEALSPYIRSVHAKDVILRGHLTVHIDEVVPGDGLFDFEELLTQVSRIPDLPVMCEHLSTPAEYDRAVSHIRAVAARLGLPFDRAK